MSDHSIPRPADVAALLDECGGRWQIEHDGELNVWHAVRKSTDGRHIRVLVGRDPAALREKIEDAEAEPDEGGQPSGPGHAQPGGGWISGPST